MNEESIFAAAIEKRSATERDAFLQEACRGDRVLQGRLAGLLKAHDEPDSFLAGPATNAAEPGLAAVFARTAIVDARVGSTIGHYKLLEQIGEGGMGIVFVAEQTEPVRRRVALKIIKPGMDTAQVIARFEAERQALAMMDHPHIAKVLDAGTTDAGRPYFAMELVRGMPITEYCDKVKLSPRQRLELFVHVCQAVQHAHQKGIIHRDLKPSNVLITLHDGTPVVKVIDFGVAKAVGHQLTERTLYTALTQLVGTPLYMSPEQAEMSGLDVDTRSDVYSLGVLLYELLTGQTPFDKEALSKAGLDEMRRIIREDEPLRPSRRFSTLGAQAISTVSQHRSVDERRLSKILNGELDWIVMKALEKDRSRRYESASAFAADIQRYLFGDPVLAHPPTAMYRFQKFARKHQPAIVTAAAIAICLLLGTTVSAWQAVRATTAEAQAQANEQKALANETKANANAAQAETKAQEATEQRDEAQKQRDEVKALNEKLVATQQELQSTLYAAHMNLAHNAWDTGGIIRVQDLLARHRPQLGKSDPRGFEWYFLDRLCHAELLTLKHPAAVLSVAYSPDGNRLASSSSDGTVRLWYAQTGQQTLAIPKAGGYIRSVAFSPDGKRLACLSGDQKVRLWDAQTGKELLGLAGADSSYLQSTVIFSPDGRRVANNGKVWDAETGQELFTLKVRGRNYREPTVYSPDGKRLATAGYNEKRAKVWDAQSGQELLTIQSTADSVVFSPNGQRLVTIIRTWGKDIGPDVKVWDSQTGEEILAFKTGTRAGVSRMVFSPDGRRLVGGSWDNVVKVWDADTGRPLATLEGHVGLIDTVAYSPDGQHVASSSRDGTVKIWRPQEKSIQEQVTFKGNDPTNAAWGVAFSPDGKRLASAHKQWVTQGRLDGTTITIWDSETGKDILSLKGHEGRAWRVVYSPDGQRLASVSEDERVKIWNAQTGEELLTLRGHTDAVVGVAYSPDGKRLASSSYDSTVKVWNAVTGESIHTLALPKGGRGDWFSPVRDVAFSPDGKRLACGAKGEVRVWDAQTGETLLTAKTPSGEVVSVAFSPDGRLLAMSAGRSVKVLDTQTGQATLTLAGHNGNVSSLTFSRDGNRLASGSWDGTVKLWNAETGQDTLTLKGHTGYVIHLAFSPDGNRLGSSDSHGTIKIWDATPLPEKP